MECVDVLALVAEAGGRPLQLTMSACGATWFTIARLVTITLLLPHMTSHEPRRMRSTSSGDGVATKHPESGTQVSPLNEPAALLSTEVHLGLLSAGQVAPVAGAAPTSSASMATAGIPHTESDRFRLKGEAVAISSKKPPAQMYETMTSEM
jgi:hypothetical protein